jgi:ABC-type transporter Mla maintaining outer membrane lipid asymmetry ATPase subunit MlaF
VNKTSSPNPAQAAGAAGPVIELADVSVGAGGRPDTTSLEAITWRISPGDYWVVGGLPGSGKSDLLATLAGLYRPLGGTLKLFGSDVAGLSEADFMTARLRIGLVFEGGGRLFNQLSVAENVALPLRYHSSQPGFGVGERVKAILDATGLTPWAETAAGRINRSRRQRVALARALALRPEVLLLDNPLGGEAFQEARWWRDVLARLADGHELLLGRPATLVVTCHDLRPWADQGKQFALLKQKRWLAIGGRADLTCRDEPLLHELMATEFGVGQPAGQAH